jgi:hypothetical protein
LERDPDAGEQVIGSLQVLESGLDPVVPTPLERSGRSDVTGAETCTRLVERLGLNAERRHPRLLPGWEDGRGDRRACMTASSEFGDRFQERSS